MKKHLLVFSLFTGPFCVYGQDIEDSRPCPVDFVPVNSGYCIERSENPPQNWSSAAEYCSINQNARLCTYSEWMVACNHSSELNLIDMVNGNWEWVDDNDGGKPGGTVGTIGYKDCSDMSRSSPDVVIMQSFRCCKSR